jgi:putative ABC transport system permease protein
MHDIRMAIRSLRRTPIVTLVAVVTLVLGIGANTAIFSFIYGLLLSPLPYPHADRLVCLWERTPSGRRNAMTTLNYLDYAHSAVFDQIAPTAVCCGATVLGSGGQPIVLPRLQVGASYFDVFGAHAAWGRTFQPGEDQIGRDHVVILSYALWLTQFGGDTSLINRPIRLNGEPYTVIGVMPADSPFGRSGLAYLPLSFPPERLIRANHWLGSMTGAAVGRLKPGVTMEQARAELHTIAARLSADYPETNKGWDIDVEPYAGVLVGDDFRRFLLLLLGAVGCVLLIGCVNLASIMLARGVSRDREIAICAALGATRGQLIRPFLTESLLVSVAGGLLGLGVGYAGMSMLDSWLRHQPLNPSFVPYWIPSEADIRLSGPVLLFTTVVSVASGIGFGILPAIRSTRPDTETLLGLYRRAAGRFAQSGVQRALIVAELVLAFVLVTCAGLLVRSLIAMQATDTGFSGSNVMTAQLTIWQHRFATDDALRVYFKRITAAVESVPGVRDVALTDGLPLQGVPTAQFFQVVGQPDVDRAQRPLCDSKATSPAYFRAMGLHVREGRALLDSDRFGAPYVTVINETMARLYFPHTDPVSQHLLMQYTRPDTHDEIPWTIVGVIADERLTPFDDPRPHPAVYVPMDQMPTMYAGLVVRTAVNPNRVREAIQQAVMAADRDQAIRNMRTVDQLEVDARAPDRMRSWLLSIFAGVALLLSGIGVYGVFAHAVVQRTRELGIRTALGARRGHLIGLVLRQGLVLTVMALGFGVVGILGVTRWLQAFLFGVQALDPVMLGVTAVVLTAVTALGCYIPARRATTVDPMIALRCE